MSKNQIRHPFLRLITILLGIFVIASCGTKPDVVPATTNPATVTSANPIPIATQETKTATPAIPYGHDVTPTPAPTIPPFTNCQEIIDAQLPKDFLTEGSIIFTGECYGKEGWYKLSAETRKITPFLDGMVSPHLYSELPDRLLPLISRGSQWLAIDDETYNINNNTEAEYLVVTGEDDGSAIRYPVNRNWGIVRGWLRNDLLNIRAIGGGAPSQDLLDPFTGKISTFYYSFPDDMSFDYRLKWIYFDNAFAREAYIDNDLHYRVREISSNRLLYTSDFRYSFWEEPQWSPDGLFFSFAGRGDEAPVFPFIAVDRNGKPRITKETFHIDGSMSFSRWSPNGKYLAILDAINQGKYQVVLWDLEQNQITKPAIPIKYALNLPEFSPNEQQFITNVAQDSTYRPKTINYLVDLPSGKVTELVLDLEPMAWLKTDKPITKPQDGPYPLPPQSGLKVNQACLRAQPTAATPKFGGGLVLVQDKYLSIYTSEKGIDKLAETPFALVSPNQKWLFYWDWQESEPQPQFWLYSLNQPPTEVAKGMYSHRLYEAVNGWFDNNELWINNDDYNSLFNPFSRKARKAPEFKRPGGENPLPIYCPSPDSSSSEFCQIYDRNFQRYVFLGSKDYPDGALIMQDPDAKILWTQSRPLVAYNMPKWQPGDKLFAIPMPKDEKDSRGEHYEIFTVDRGGQQTQLTYYTAAYPTMTIDGFSWSPDGRYIAFWGDTHSQENIAQQNPYRLFVLDTVTRQTVDYCVARNEDVRSDGSDNRAPVWSPDGKQIAVNGLLDGKHQILLVDFSAEIVTPVAEGGLVGWMAEK